MKLFCLPFCLIILALGGCATEPSVDVNQEAVARRDRAIGDELAQQFEPLLKIRKDTEVAIYLRKVAQHLVESNAELRGKAFGVLMIRDRESKWYNYGLPGQRIYLSAGMLRVVEYENEIAAAIAVQLAHIMNKDVLKRLLQNSPNSASSQSPGDPEFSRLVGAADLNEFLLSRSNGLGRRIEFFGPSGIFYFSDKAETGAVGGAAGILYRAGYDSRGLISLYQRYIENQDHSPYDRATIEGFIEEARRAIASYAPLRNPVLRTQGFLKIQKRLRHL